MSGLRPVCINFFYKRNLLLNDWSKFKITSHKCSSSNPLLKLPKGLAPSDKMAARTLNRSIYIWTGVRNYFPILKYCQQPFTNELFCSKVGIIRNELLFLWILLMCKLLRITPQTLHKGLQVLLSS